MLSLLGQMNTLETYSPSQWVVSFIQYIYQFYNFTRSFFFFCECLFISYKTTITQCLLTVTQYPKSNNNTKLNLLTHLRSNLPLSILKVTI